MKKSNQNGISAITAATMIAAGSFGELETHNAHNPTKVQSGRKTSPWSRYGRRVGQVNGAGDSVKRRCISYAFGETLKAPFVDISTRTTFQDRDTKETDSQSKTESLSNIGSSASSLYATLLVCIFIAFSFSGLVTFPLMYQWLDTHGFFVYLYIVSIIYLLYLIFHVVNKGNESEDGKKLKVVENIEVKSDF